VMDFRQIKNFWIKGNPEKALRDPNKAILTESTAKRYYGNEDPIGKLFRLDNKVDIEVSGIVKDIPATTHLPANLFISFSTLSNKDLMAGLDVNYWGFRSSGYCYIKMQDQALSAVIQKNAKNDIDKKEKFLLQPVSSIHFDPKYETSNPNYTVSEQYLKMLLLLGAFITLIACVNYINLSTSLVFTKSKEVGIRKTIGASKS
ncbi:MAG: ABC transporter permease, partial [Chitinophagaceae bacterium]